MPSPARLPRRTLRPRFAALGVIGVLACSVPLLQVLRVQSAELRSLIAHQEALDPISHTVSLQWALLGHRDLAAQVLSGDDGVEAERQTREREVDAQALRVHRALEIRGDPLAVDEAQALRDDWELLVRDVNLRRIGAPRSNEAHRLLIEQTLQIIDFVSTAAGPLPAALAPMHALLQQQIPRLALIGMQVETGAAQPDVDRNGDHEADRDAGGHAERTAALAGTQAWRAAQRTAQAAQAVWAQQLGARQQQLQLHLAAASVGLLLLALGVWFGLRRRRRSAALPPAGADPVLRAAGNPSREEAQRLLQRLRGADASAVEGDTDSDANSDAGSNADGTPAQPRRSPRQDPRREGPPTDNAALPPG